MFSMIVFTQFAVFFLSIAGNLFGKTRVCGNNNIEAVSVRF